MSEKDRDDDPHPDIMPPTPPLETLLIWTVIIIVLLLCGLAVDYVREWFGK